MLSSLSYAILAMLAENPQTGYDLSRHMKLPLGYVWQAKHGQIYPELARLAEAGLVRFRRDDNGLGPPRRVYSITRTGRAELTKWVAAAPHARPMNDELVVKAFAMGRIKGAAADALLQDQIRAHEHRLGALEQRSEAISPGAGGLNAFRFGEYAVLRRAIGVERELIAWCRWLASQLELEGNKSKPIHLKGAAAPRRSPGVSRRKLRRS